MQASTVLLAEDDPSLATVLKTALTRRGWRVRHTDNGATLLNWVKKGEGDVAVTDVVMPVGERTGSGLDVLRDIKKNRPQLPVIVISAQNSLMTAVESNARGAYDYLPKPFDLNALIDRVDKALAFAQPAPAYEHMENSPVVGTSPAMQEVYRTIARVAPLELTILITGEAGTGKELIARTLHRVSAHKDEAFTATSEITSQAGTAFIDDVGDLSPAQQEKLMAALQGQHPRLICATRYDLAARVREGQFREDLYYRLNVVPLRLPPLRERKEDVPALVAYFLEQAQAKGMPRKRFSREALHVLQAQLWPGNVRELENAVQRVIALTPEQEISGAAMRAALSSPATVQACSLESDVRAHLERYFAAHAGTNPPAGLYERIAALVDKPLLEITLRSTGGNQIKAAQILGINRNTLRKRMQELKIRL